MELAQEEIKQEQSSEILDNQQKVSYLTKLLQFFKTRTPVCKHEHSCFENALRGFIENISVGVAVRFALSLTSSILKRKWQGIIFRAIKADKEMLRLGIFFGAAAFVYKCALCSLRRIKNQDKPYYAFIAGVLSGATLYIESPKTRQTIAIYMFARSTVIFYFRNSWSTFQKSNYHVILLYGVITTFLTYCWLFEADIMNKKFALFFDKVNDQTPNEKYARLIWNQATNFNIQKNY